MTTTDEVYDVEKIVGKDIVKGVTVYRVKWEGYPASQNTWETAEHLEGCEDLIEEYERQIEQLKGRNTSSKSVAVSLPKKLDKPERSDSSEEEIPENHKGGVKQNKINRVSNGTFGKNNQTNKNGYSDEDEPKKKVSKPVIKPLEKSKPNHTTVDETQELEDMESELNGPFFSDIPEEIIGCKYVTGQIYFKIKWKMRKTGTICDESWVENSLLKYRYPFLCLEFYEKKIKVKN